MSTAFTCFSLASSPDRVLHTVAEAVLPAPLYQRLSASSLAKRLARGSLWSLAGSATSRLLVLAAMIWGFGSDSDALCGDGPGAGWMGDQVAIMTRHIHVYSLYSISF